MGTISLFIVAGAFISYQDGLNGPAVAAGVVGGLLLFVTASRFIGLSSEGWSLTFDEDKAEFEWHFKAKREVIPVADLKQVEFRRKMRADGVSDSIVIFHLKDDAFIELPNEFNDITTIDKIKSICKKQGVIFLDCREDGNLR